MLNIYDLVCLGFIAYQPLLVIYSLSTIVVYLMPNPVFTYILNIYDLVWLGFIAYQPV